MTDPKPWFADEQSADADARFHAPATLRNRDAILAVLHNELADAESVLEIASGSGEHARFFAEAMPNLRWQPSDASEAALASIAAWRQDGPANLQPPLRLDVMHESDWPDLCFDALFVANLSHIAPFAVTEALFDGASRVLAPDGRILIYGPFFRDDSPPSEGDLSFDASLRARDPALGIRHVDEIDRAAAPRGFRRVAVHVMPANNLTLVFVRA